MKSNVIIQHKDGRQVIGVEPATLRLPGEHAFPYWTKDNISYFRKDGWEALLRGFIPGVEPPARGRRVVTIEHDKHGVIGGAKESFLMLDGTPYSCWEKNGATYFSGWREVKEKKWGPVDTSIERDGKTLVAWVNNPVDTYPMHFNLGNGYRWSNVLIEKELS